MKHKWQTQYDKKSPPWDYDKFDPDFKKFFKDYSVTIKNQKIIDLGCGTGSQIHYIQKLGFTNTTGTDIVNALEYDVKNFIIDDALDSKLDQRYDIVFDRGLLHNIYHLKNRIKYFKMLNDITHEKSYIVLKVMSPYEPRMHPSIDAGPYRFSEKQLQELFNVIGFKCVELKDTFFHSNSIVPHLRGYFSVYNWDKDHDRG